MRPLLAVIGLGAVLALLVWGVGAGLQAGGDRSVIENETWTPDVGNETLLEESQRDGAYYSPTVAVYDENATRAEAGQDYAWDDSDGTIQALDGGILENDSSATVTYAFVQPTDRQQDFAALLSLFPRSLSYVLPVGVFLTMLLVLARVLS